MIEHHKIAQNRCTRLVVVGFGVGLLFVDLNVCLGQCDHLRENVCDVQILHFVPLAGRFLQNMHTIRALRGLAVMNDIRNQIVASVLVALSILFR